MYKTSKLVLLFLLFFVFTSNVNAETDANYFSKIKSSLLTNENSLPLVKHLKNIDYQEQDGSTLLLWASHYEQSDLVEHLLKQGSNPNIKNIFGATPLMEAVNNANFDIVKLLLRSDANPNTSNAENETVLMAAARTGNIKIATQLIKHGAVVNAVESWGGQTALMWAAAQHQNDMIKLLLRKGAEVNARAYIRDWERRVTAEPRIKELDSAGLTPLLYAARAGCQNCVKTLVKGGADINLPSPDGVSPLLIALLNNHFDTAKTLIDLGANVKQWDWWGRTPLYQAIDMNTLPQGGRPDLPSLDKETGLSIAKKLLENGADPNFQLKMKPPLRHIVQDRLADVMLSTGATPLIRAARAADNEALTLLLEFDANVNLNNAEGVSPLMAASWVGGTRGKFKTEEQGVKAINTLLKAGANINNSDSRGVTALHGAARQGWNNAVALLVKNNANLNAKDNEGLSVYDYTMGKADKIGFGIYDVVGELPETAALLKQLGAQ